MVKTNGSRIVNGNDRANDHMITLNIHIPHDNVVHSMQFDVQMLISDICHNIQQHLLITIDHELSEYGLFINDTQHTLRSYWLDPSKTLIYYALKNGDHVEYKNRYRPLKIRLLDGTVKTILIDDSLIVAQLMVYICTKFGIANYDEYSLVYDIDMDNNTNASKTATLLRDRSLQRTDKKMEELRKKCHTDDDTLWLDQSKTLRQQNIDEQSTVTLRRKYFFSDTNIDQRDPVQLNLLYVQCRNGIIDGTHPVTYDEAIQFSGLQCQIQFGDHDESKHKPGIIDIRDFLPKEYSKTKNVEKRIFLEHKKHKSLSALDGKVKYTQLCRALRTYGVTFFLVKEKMSGKNKLVPRLLGVTKESVVRVDERTKDFIQVWPLTHVKRWTASPNTFTLDFGDYASAYYSVQTHEGQQISQLIAGYIDIILKKRKDRDDNTMGDHIPDEEATIIEDIIAPGKATIIQPNRPPVDYVRQQNVYSPPLIRGTFSENANHADHHQKGEYFTSKIHEQPKSLSDIHHSNGCTTLFSAIENARNTTNTIQSHLSHELTMEYTQQSQPVSSIMDHQRQHQYSIENRLDASRQLLTSTLSTINASTAHIIILTSDVNTNHHRNFDYNNSLSSTIVTITNNLNEFSNGINVYINLIDDKTNLLDQSRRLCITFNDLLICIKTLIESNYDSATRQNVLLTASRLGEINQDLIRRITNDFDCSIDYQDKLLSLSKSVANTTALYVLKAKDIATNVQEQQVVNEIISTATQCALATSQLVACTKVVAATISSPLCQEQLIESARNVTRSIEAVLQSCLPPTIIESSYCELNEGGKTVRRTLGEFLLHIKLVTDSTEARSERTFSPMINNQSKLFSHRMIAHDEIEELDEENQDTQHDESIDQILMASDQLFSSVGDTAEMVKQAKILAQATAQLVSSLRQQAESVDDDTNQQQRFLSAAKMLADATAKMVESAKICATKPHDAQLQYQLKKSVEELRLATNMATSDHIKRKVLKRVEQCAKHCASYATQCIAATSASAVTHKHHQSHQDLVQQCKVIADLIPHIVQSIRACMIKPDAYACQNNLLNTCEDFLGPATHLTNLINAILPSIQDQSQILQLTNSSKQLSHGLNDLRPCLNRAQELCYSTPLDTEAIVESIELLDRQLNDTKQQVNDGNIDIYNAQFNAICKHMNTTISQLINAVNQNDEKALENYIHDVLQALRKLIVCTRHIIAASNDLQIQKYIIERLHDVLQHFTHFLCEAKKSIRTVNEQNNLSHVAHDLFSALNSCTLKITSQRYLNEAIKQMSEYIYTLAGPFDRKLPPAPIDSDEINRSAAMFNQATHDLVISTHAGGTQDLAQTSAHFSRAFGEFIDNGIDYVNHQQEDEKRSRLIISLKNVHTSSNQLLERAKSMSVEPITKENNIKSQLADAARAVTETINDVITACLVTKSTVAMEHIECDNAIREMETSKILLQQSVSQPCTNYTYFEALDNVVENSKRLGEAMTHIASASKNTNHQLFVQAVHEASKAVYGLVESSAQASYLIGISEITSTKGTDSIVDQVLFNRFVTSIRHACSDLSNPSIDRSDILTLATTIAKNTSALCNISRDASSNTTNLTARRRFVQSAKDVANATAELVRTIKILDGSYTQESHRHCIETSRPLVQAIDELHSYAMSKEFASIPPTISSAGRQLQEPILSAAKNVVDGACRIVECSKTLIINSKDASLWQQLATHTKSVSEAIKRLATSVKEMTPGQHECERAVEELRKLFQEVDTAIMNVDSLRKTDKSVEFHQEQISSSSHFLTELVNSIRHAAKCEAERINSYVSKFITYLESFLHHTINYVSYMTHRQEKLPLLEQSKSLVETSLQLILSTKESGGNVKHIQWHKIVDNNSDLLVKLINNLVHTIEEQSSAIGTMNGLCENIYKLISTLDSTMTTNQGHFIDYQSRMTETLRQITKTIEQIHHSSDVVNLANQLTCQYNELIHVTYGAMGTATTNDLAVHIKNIVKDLGLVFIELIEKLGRNNSNSDLNILYRKLIEKISYILTVLRGSAHGIEACITAASAVSSIITDLDTTILYANSGSLNSEHVDESFSDHREAILKTAKLLVEDTKTLVAGAASSQEQLAQAAQAAVRTITKLAAVVKFGAESLGTNDNEAQIMLINSIKDVAVALHNLMNVTRSASGKNIMDPEMQKLKESAKVMVTKVTSLLRTVKSVEDKAQRGTHALESTVESISQELQNFNNGQLSLTRTSPEELVHVTKQITVATAKAVSAGQSCQQDDITSAANMGRKSITDLLVICKSTACLTDDKNLQKCILDNGRTCVENYKELLETIHMLIHNPSNETKQRLLNYSRTIMQSTQELVRCAQQLKGTDFIDPDDPSYRAENELLYAAQSIESAAKKLSSLKPRRKVQEVNENLNFDEQILEAAKSIMNAAGALITAATLAQKELVAQGKLSSKSSSDAHGQWSEGLISAASYVASACHVLCDAANELVQGHGTEEKLISSAKQVSSNTAALLVACKVKADFMSQSMTRLQNAGNAVKRAADTLVRSAQQAADMKQEDQSFEVSTSLVTGIAQEIKCKEAILTKERELDEARNRLKAIRLAKYGHNEQESNDST
ncbi:unnamed protein product [Rotaria socialis]|uniref:Talin n=1 Tax=Rotaria socialis TaxID=392032 RepID=A0A817WFK3_9BILA|nr:unnamed protein product [Rotaria socialis]CAF4770347.1 unnamed protein product [Rotaria socialis]